MFKIFENTNLEKKIMDLIKIPQGHEPLNEYPWKEEIFKLLAWTKGRQSHVQAFCFDLAMSLAYIDSTSGLEKYMEYCDNVPGGYNSHLGFINLCSPCYEKGIWTYQKAAKPQSGALGKLSSEMMLGFVKGLSKQLREVKVIGGTESIDALLIHEDGLVILGEVKSAPLITYPLLFTIETSGHKKINHSSLNITSSQLRESKSAIYMQEGNYIPLGKVGQELWPFKQAIDYIVNKKNEKQVYRFIETWLNAKEAYCRRDKSKKIYYLANASGSPPQIAVSRDKWPKSQSISDSKTSAGMDRTDDIKKGIYQVLKLGSKFKDDKEGLLIKTALISNLPAYRHGDEYVKPFVDMIWAKENDIEQIGEKQGVIISNMRRVFDFIITIEDPILREITL
jgi:hypothetical protein